MVTGTRYLVRYNAVQCRVLLIGIVEAETWRCCTASKASSSTHQQLTRHHGPVGDHSRNTFNDRKTTLLDKPGVCTTAKMPYRRLCQHTWAYALRKPSACLDGCPAILGTRRTLPEICATTGAKGPSSPAQRPA